MLRNSKYSGKTRITSATTTQVRNGPCVLGRIVIAVPVATGTITIYDAQSGTDNPLCAITSTADLKPFHIDFDCQMSNGIRIVTTQAQDVLVVYE